jgi:glyoxylase I family protein
VKIGHIALSVSSIDKSIAFYRKNFGLVCREKYRHPELGFTIAIIKKNNIALELFEFKKHKKLPQYRRDLDTELKTLGVKHFSLEVTNIENTLRRLKKNKVRFATDISTFDTGQRYFFIRDPDGILVELMQARK